MSDLPKYQRLPDVEQGLWGDKSISLSDEGGPEAGPSDHVDPEAVYPPTTGGKRVDLCFRPRYPCGGVKEDAWGEIGRTQAVRHALRRRVIFPDLVLTHPQETIAIVRAAFPPLREFPPDRVEFMLKNNGSDWQRVLPNVWETIAKDPPERLGVRIADGPGDAEERQRRGGSPVF